MDVSARTIGQRSLRKIGLEGLHIAPNSSGDGVTFKPCSTFTLGWAFVHVSFPDLTARLKRRRIGRRLRGEVSATAVATPNVLRDSSCWRA